MLEMPTHWGTVAKKVTEIFQKQVQRNIQRKETIKKVMDLFILSLL